MNIEQALNEIKLLNDAWIKARKDHAKLIQRHNALTERFYDLTVSVRTRNGYRRKAAILDLKIEESYKVIGRTHDELHRAVSAFYDYLLNEINRLTAERVALGERYKNCDESEFNDIYREVEWCNIMIDSRIQLKFELLNDYRSII